MIQWTMQVHQGCVKISKLKCQIKKDSRWYETWTLKNIYDDDIRNEISRISKV